MADLMQGASEYESGTLDTAAILVNNVSPMNANQPNGLADAIIQMQHILGSGPDLKGTLADLATRLAVQMTAGGIVLPIGSIIMHGGLLPTGFLDCFGQEISTTGVTANIATVYGTTFGNGNGVDTINMPDLRGRCPFGIGSGTGGGASGTGKVTGGTALANVLLGGWFGEAVHTLSIAELPTITPTVNDPGHQHMERGGSGGGGASARTMTTEILGDFGVDNDTSNTTDTRTTGITITPFGSGNSHNVLNPGLGLRFIAKY